METTLVSLVMDQFPDYDNPKNVRAENPWQSTILTVIEDMSFYAPIIKFIVLPITNERHREVILEEVERCTSIPIGVYEAAKGSKVEGLFFEFEYKGDLRELILDIATVVSICRSYTVLRN